MKRLFTLLFLLFFSRLIRADVPETTLAFQVMKKSGEKEVCILETFVRSTAGAKVELRVLNSVEIREIGVKLDAVLSPGPKGSARVKLDSFFGIPDEGAFFAPGMEARNTDLSLAVTQYFPQGRFFPTSILTSQEKEFFVPLVCPVIRRHPAQHVQGTGKCEFSFLVMRRDELLKKISDFSFRDPDRASVLAETEACRKWSLPHHPFRVELNREVFYRGKGVVPSRTKGSRTSVALAGNGLLKVEFSDVREAGSRVSGSSELPGIPGRFPVFETVFFRSVLRRPENGKWVVIAAFSSFSSGEKTFFEEKAKAVPKVFFIFFRSSY